VYPALPVNGGLLIMFERFTDRARKVMALANDEAQRLRHPCIATEHILLGLVREGSGVGANVLKNLGVDLKTIRSEVEKLVKLGSEPPSLGRLPISPRAKEVINSAIEEARRLNHNYVGTEHMLLGLVRVKDGVAAAVLANLGLNLDQVRSEVLGVLCQEPPSPQFSTEAASEAADDESSGTSEARARTEFMATSAGETVELLAEVLRRELRTLERLAKTSGDQQLEVAYRDIADEMDALLRRLMDLHGRRQRPEN
jgi:ATP-dependent Clp protease ATP-binding subunit ClpC